MYGISVLSCMSSALSAPDGAGLGTLGLPESRAQGDGARCRVRPVPHARHRPLDQRLLRSPALMADATVTYCSAMSEPIELDDVKAFAAGLSPWAHLASVGADGMPDVMPVHPCWEGDICWVMVGTDSVKVRNVEANADVALHWQVNAMGDGLEVWGTAEVFADLATKRRLWTGVFDYDLNAVRSRRAGRSPGTGSWRSSRTSAVPAPVRHGRDRIAGVARERGPASRRCRDRSRGRVPSSPARRGHGPGDGTPVRRRGRRVAVVDLGAERVLRSSTRSVRARADAAPVSPATSPTTTSCATWSSGPSTGRAASTCWSTTPGSR